VRDAPCVKALEEKEKREQECTDAFALEEEAIRYWLVGNSTIKSINEVQGQLTGATTGKKT